MTTPPAIRLALLLAGILTLPVRAAVRLEVHGIDNPLLENVRLYVGLPPGDAPLVVRRHAESAADRAREALEALGHYEAGIRVSARRDGETRVIRLDIDSGPPVLLSSILIAIEGEASGDPAFAEWRRTLPLREGDPLHHGRYEEAKRSIHSLALSRGYFDGGFLQSEILVRREQREADILLRYDSGRRYRFGPVRLSPTPLSPRLLLRMLPFAEGDPYTAAGLAALHRQYLDSDYFDDVRLTPRPGEADSGGLVPIDADLSPAPPNRIGLGIGITTDVGPRLRVEWARPWVNRHGHSALFQNELSLVRQDLSAQYSVPLKPPLAHQLQFTAGWQHEDIEDTERHTLRAGVQRRRLHANGWQFNTFVRWEQERFTQADVRDTTTLTLPGFSLGRTRSRGGLFPDRGDRLFALVEAAHPDLLSDIRLARLLLQAKRLDSWGPHRLLARIEGGVLDTEDFDRTPPSLRFFAGGDQSVRGFAYQSLAPRNDENELVGGRYLLTGSLEYNFQFAPRWRAAVFTDIGNAAANHRFSDGFAQGAGFGLRWLSPLAPVKLDFAWGVSESDPPFRIHFSMGTDL